MRSLLGAGWLAVMLATPLGFLTSSVADEVLSKGVDRLPEGRFGVNSMAEGLTPRVVVRIHQEFGPFAFSPLS